MLHSRLLIINLFIFNFTGVIKTKARIDYESIKQIYVNAYVTDTGIPQMTSTAEIIVEIVNMNDNEPVFSLPEYRFTVAENSPKGNFIGKINAKDDDDGELFVHTTLEQKSILDYPLSVALLLLSTPIDPTNHSIPLVTILPYNL